MVGLVGSHVRESRPVRARVIHSPASNSDPDLEIRLLALERRDTAVARSGAGVHILDVECLGVDKGKGKVDVRPVTQRYVFRLHITTRALIVPALIVADGARVGGAFREVALRLRHRIRAAKVDRCAAKAVFAAAHIERACSQIGILQAPITAIALGLAFAIACAFGAAENRAEAAGSSPGIINNDRSASWPSDLSRMSTHRGPQQPRSQGFVAVHV